ncbi:uncharacterized protein LOC109426472 [Aedes albopictus]|uniref:Zinc finger PHD-type domain-containing protein n=1 Tax=Aedes albopictus TaxID=7160 RepID=A0ABM1Y2R1_AEDAL
MASDSESAKDKTVRNLTETSCGICGASICDEMMVECDGCTRCFHIRCVGIQSSKLPKNWYCHSEACQEKALEYQKQKKQTRSRKQTEESDKASVNFRSEASIVETRVRALEDRHKRQLEELEVEMQLRKKEQEMQRAFEKKKMEMELQMSAEEEEEKGVWQAKMLQKKRGQIQRMKANWESFEKQMADLDKELAGLSSGKVLPASKSFADVMFVSPSGKSNQNALKLMKANIMESVEDDEGTEGKSEVDEYCENSDRHSQSSDSSMGEKVKKNVSLRNWKQVNSGSQNGLGQQQPRPTKAQLAARQGLTYKLPKFSGKPAQWPLFYAAYKASNATCGYMNHENLMRLQEALEGDALELVSGQLLLPETIPRVIEKLRRHYGRPEQLLESLLDKINRLDPPQPDSLKSFIPFGNTVEQLCDHMEAADMRQHLVNPLLIKSLVAKLPDREKREWVHYRRGRGEVTLRTLTDFLMDIVADACEANVDMEFEQLHQSITIPQPEESEEHAGLYCHSVTTNSAANVSKEKTHRREFHNSSMHPVENTFGLSANDHANCAVLFRIVPVQLHYKGKTISVLAFLDEGASVTLMEQKLADRLGAVGVQERLTIRWTGDVSRVEDSRRMSLWTSSSSANASDKTLLHTVHTVQNLKLPHQKLDYEEIAAQYAHLRGLPIESYEGQPKLLIGANNIHSFAPMEARVGNPMEPIAVRTNLGWTVYGPRYSTSVAASNYLGYHQQIISVDQHKHFKSRYATEDTMRALSQETDEEKELQRSPERTNKPTSNCFETELLGKIDDLQIPDSYPRTLPTKKRFEKNQKRCGNFAAPPKQRLVIEGTTTKRVSVQEAYSRREEQPKAQRSGSWSVLMNTSSSKWKRQSGSSPENIQQQSKCIDEQNPLKLGDSEFGIHSENRRSLKREDVEVNMQSSDGRIRQARVSPLMIQNRIDVVERNGKFENAECYGLGCCDAVVSFKESLNRPNNEHH